MVLKGIPRRRVSGPPKKSPEQRQQDSRTKAMARMRALGKSYTEIGEAFGGRDHTTVLYATRKIAELKDSDHRVAEDYNNLLRTLSN